MGKKQMILVFTLVLLAFPKIVFAKDNRDDEDRKFGFYTDRAVVSTQTILFNEALNKRVSEIGNKVVQASDKPDMKYTFRIINDSTINAYSAAGGFVYLNTGLLDILESEDELAAVIAHEVTHTSKNHQINFIYAAHQRQFASQVVGTSLAVAFTIGVTTICPVPLFANTYNPFADMLAKQVVNTGLQLGGMMGNVLCVSMIKGYGKKQELEADALAVQYTKKAGYDPNALISVFKKLISIRNKLGINDKNYVSSLINAEPKLEERIKIAEELILNPNKNKQPKIEG